VMGPSHQTCCRDANMENTPTETITNPNFNLDSNPNPNTS